MDWPHEVVPCEADLTPAQARPGQAQSATPTELGDVLVVRPEPVVTWQALSTLHDDDHALVGTYQRPVAQGAPSHLPMQEHGSWTGERMAIQAERPADHLPTPAAGRPSRRFVAAVTVGAVLAAATVAVAFGLQAGHGQRAAPQPPKAVLGQSLESLAIHRVVSREPTRRLRPGEMRVPRLGVPGATSILRSDPAVTLHVQYAHVRPVRGHWQVGFIAPESATFNMDSRHGHYEAVVDSKGLILFFVGGGADGTNFGFGGGTTLTKAAAVALARSLTTSVSVAQCTQAAIAANNCI